SEPAAPKANPHAPHGTPRDRCNEVHRSSRENAPAAILLRKIDHEFRTTCVDSTDASAVAGADSRSDQQHQIGDTQRGPHHVLTDQGASMSTDSPSHRSWGLIWIRCTESTREGHSVHNLAIFPIHNDHLPPKAAILDQDPRSTRADSADQ